MIARAYPEHFEIHKSGGGGSVGSFFDDMEWSSPFDLMFDPYAFYYSPMGSYRGFVDPSFYSFGGYIIVPAPTSGGTAQDAGNARVVNGAGYTRVEPRQPPVIVGPRPSASSGDSYGSASSSSSSGSASSSSGGGTTASTAGYSSGGGGAQTAVPR
jgi:hypothetical protein